MADKLDVDADLVRKLADLLAETGLGEIEYEDAGKRIRVARPGQLMETAVAAASVPAATADAVADAASEPSLRAGAVTSPMVGTVYLAPAPGEPAFVRPGDAIAEGQTLLMVEAMKTFNEIKAPCSGTLARIVVTDGQPVEFGEVLAFID